MATIRHRARAPAAPLVDMDDHRLAAEVRQRLAGKRVESYRAGMIATAEEECREAESTSRRSSVDTADHSTGDILGEWTFDYSFSSWTENFGGTAAGS
jgi:hypothetical protein